MASTKVSNGVIAPGETLDAFTIDKCNGEKQLHN